MQSVCRLSRRWHQQFCLSPSFASHQVCLTRWQTVRPYRQRAGRNPPTSRPAVAKHEIATPTLDTGDLVVREYEQDERDPTQRRPVNPEDEPIAHEEQTVKEQLERLEDELRAMRRGAFAPENAFMQSLPKDEREVLLREVEALGGTSTLDELVTDEDLESDPAQEDGELAAGKAPEVTLRIPAKHKVYVKQFNNALKDVKDEPGTTAKHLQLWKWYLRCQQNVPNFSHFVSEDVWDLLWDSQMTTYARTRHIVVLARDMIGAEHGLGTAQLLDYIEALEKTGETASALSDWEGEKERASGIEDRQLATRFWATGVHLYAALGRPNKAEETALMALDNDLLDASVFVDVIDAWAKSQKPNAGAKVWSCYLRLKKRYPSVTSGATAATGSETTIPVATLGHLSSTLLNNDRQDMALAVFRDMLAAHTRKGDDSVQVFSRLVENVRGFDNASPSEDNVSQVGLKALVALPSRFKNKYFFGAWIKWLIGDGKVNDAALVVELMQELAVKPDARHLNGMIGAWMRDSSSASRERAEQMAWGMIHARVEQAISSNAAAGVVQLMDRNPYADKRRLPRFLQRKMPAATVETFSILLQRYTRQGDTAKSLHLTDVLTGPARLKPNSFILNHWLYMSLRTDDLKAIWSRYMSVKHEISPDLETFAVLWSGMRRNLDRAQRARSPEYPEPRQLFFEMMRWLDKLSEQKASMARGDFAEDLYEQVIRCFCLHSDLSGTFAALNAFREVFAALPSEDVSRMILMQVSRMLPLHLKNVSRARRAARGPRVYRSVLSSMANVLQSIADDRGSVALEEGATVEEVEDPNSRVAQQLRFDNLRVFIGMVLRRMQTGTGDATNDIVLAAKTMGLELTADDVRPFIDQAKHFEAVFAGGFGQA